MRGSDGTPRKEAVAALLRPDPDRVAGTPRSYSFNEHSGVFRVRYKSAARSPAMSDFVVPDVLFPKSYRVACNNCSVAFVIRGLALLDGDAQLFMQ